MYYQLGKVCKNSVFPNVKMGSALGAVHLSAKCMEDHRGVGPWSSDANIRLRVIATHFREIFTVPEVKRRLVSQAGMGPW